MSLASYRLNHPTAVPYIYQALGKFQIRLLALAPGEESDEIHIRLKHIDLKTDRYVKYEALSYVWGTSEPTQHVVVDTDDGPSQFIPVRDNLVGALRRIRDTSTNKTLWIDALCLNQSDDNEKSHQVPLMGDIYSRAARVIVWLGPEREDSSSAMTMLQHLGENSTLDWTKYTLETSKAFQDIWITLLNSPSTKTSLIRLLERDWFERLWVLQEVYLSQRATVFCGPSEVEWTVFITAALSVTCKIPGIPGSHMGMIVRLADRRPREWTSLRTVVAGKKCMDLRDKIYGMLAMLEDNDTCPFNVDCSLSVPEVYTAAAKHYIRTYHSLELFTSCELTSQKLDNLPSWVPDWSTDLTSEVFDTAAARATGATCPLVYFPGTGTRTMRLAGVMSSKVQYVEPLGGTLDEATGAIVRLTQSIGPGEKYAHGNQSFGDALICALIGGQYRHSGFPHMVGNPNREECRSAGRCILSLAAGAEADSVAKTAYLKQMNWIYAVWRGRALFLTEDGHIGLGSPAATNGDELFLPLGSDFPLLVRRKDGSQKNERSVIGVCYVTGLMAGEILYGPLPSNCCLVQDFYFKPNGRRRAFHRMKSNHELNSEPDLEFEKERTRKAFGVEDEKLLTFDLLESKGVPVEWIDLV